MPTIPVNATSHLLENASRTPALAIAARRFARDDRRIAGNYVTHALEELIMPLLVRAVGTNTIFNVGNDAFLLIESATPAVLSDLQDHLASRLPLGQVATIARFREPNQGSPELLDALNALTATLDYAAFKSGIVAVSVPTLGQVNFDRLNPNEAVDDEQQFLNEMNDVMRSAIVAFAIARNEPAGVPWPDSVHQAIKYASNTLDYVGTCTPPTRLRFNIAVRLLKEMKRFVTAPRAYSVGKADAGVACIGYHPAFPAPVLAVVNDDGVVTSIHERSRFPQVDDGDEVHLRY